MDCPLQTAVGPVGAGGGVGGLRLRNVDEKASSTSGGHAGTLLIRLSCPLCPPHILQNLWLSSGPFYPTVPVSSIRSCPWRPASVSPYVTRRGRRERAIDKSDKAIFHSPFSQHCFCERRATSALSTLYPGGSPQGVFQAPGHALTSNDLVTLSRHMFIVVCGGVLHTLHVCVCGFYDSLFSLQFWTFPTVNKVFRTFRGCFALFSIGSVYRV